MKDTNISSLMGDHLDEVTDAIINGKYNEIEGLVKAAIDDNVKLDAIINDAMIAAMDVVGKKFSDSEIFVPEMLVSAVTMKKGLELIKPLLKGDELESKGTIVMCTVLGDIHDIGKNLVIMMLQGAGFHCVNLGVNIPADKLIQEVKEIKPDIIGISALLTTSMPHITKVTEGLKANGLRNSVKVMVGGAPVDATFAEKIGADGYGKDAAEAVSLARRFVSEK